MSKQSAAHETDPAALAAHETAPAEPFDSQETDSGTQGSDDAFFLELSRIGKQRKYQGFEHSELESELVKARRQVRKVQQRLRTQRTRMRAMAARMRVTKRQLRRLEKWRNEVQDQLLERDNAAAVVV